MKATFDMVSYQCSKLVTEKYSTSFALATKMLDISCLKVFVKGNTEAYNNLKESAMALGSAFQKVNFLRDVKADFEELNRSYFPNTNLTELDEASKKIIVNEISADFQLGYEGILKLPMEAKFGV